MTLFTNVGPAGNDNAAVWAWSTTDRAGDVTAGSERPPRRALGATTRYHARPRAWGRADATRYAPEAAERALPTVLHP